MTRAIPAVILVAVAIAVGVYLLIGSSGAGSQEAANNFTRWPPFVAIFETDGRGAVSGDGPVDTGRIKRELVWNSRTDWKVTTTEAPTIEIAGDNYSEVGSYESRHGQTYTVYDSWFGFTQTEELAAREEPIPAGMFSELAVYGSRVAARTDGRVVLLDMTYCDGVQCDIAGPRSDTGQTYTEGQQFGTFPTIYTNDEFLIPVRAGDTEVLELRTNPPTPTPTPTPTQPTPTPTPMPQPLNGNPRTESMTGTTVTVSWGKLGTLPRPGSGTDYRVNYRQSASESWMFGNYVDTQTFSNSRPQATVPREGSLRCNTEYEFQVQVQIRGQGDTWHDYGTLTARTRAC